MPYRWEWSYNLDVQGQWYIAGSLEVGNDIKAKTIIGNDIKAKTIKWTLIWTDAEVTVDTEATATPVAINVDWTTLYLLAYPEADPEAD
jgi:hypothetical protein